ncbi:hypothetical protein LOAG_17692 [Loa loa]|uniref:BED-type domain-containing protein n=1 Tax=Loa loa TaxID=7209 RepID=A0A1S0UIA0_LOALO|nr:hypothetical protein LOAG_17692 [Loa loa]EJD75098.1 hypothetical protein LOAG_17692 [Loa loa]
MLVNTRNTRTLRQDNFAIRKSTKVEDSTDDTMKRARTEMSTSSVISGTSTKSTGYNSIVIPAPIVPSQYNAKNAGRKKTNPVWNYFVDLKTKGLSGVRCRYCEWITNDRSPTTLKFHLKRKHDTGLGGVWNIVEERIGINQPQGRSRFVINNKNGETVPFMIPVDTEIRPEPDRDQQCYPEAGARVVVDAKPSSSQQALLDQFIQNATKKCEGDDAGESNEPSYVLSDGSNLSELLRVANDMDLAFTYNSRRTGEFCFESNAQDMRGRLVVFADLGTKVAVRERFNGSDLSYEEWSKADWKQFLWAVRGKCMNVLRGL